MHACLLILTLAAVALALLPPLYYPHPMFTPYLVHTAADGLLPGTGHFHVFVDVAEQPEEGEAIPFDDAHKHYGKGQTAADIELTPVGLRLYTTTQNVLACIRMLPTHHAHQYLCAIDNGRRLSDYVTPPLVE